MVSATTQYNDSLRDSVNAANLRSSRSNIINRKNQTKVDELYGKKYDSTTSLSEKQQLVKATELTNLQRQASLKNRILDNKAPLKAKLLLAQSQKRIKRHQRPIWILNFIIAGYLDILNPIIAAIPYIGWIIGPILSFCGGAYINFSLWRVGNIKTRTKRRSQRGVVSLLNSIPYINFIPFSLAIVERAYKDSKESAEKAKSTIERLQKKYPNLVVE